MFIIGVTGGIGSGKSTICHCFELVHIPVFYADAAARQVMQSDELLIEQIKTAFGYNSYLADGSLNRKYIASKVFDNEDELKALNALVHPAVFRLFANWTTLQSAPYVVKEAALLFESNSYKDCDYSILVTSPLELRLQRVVKRDHTTRDEVLRRITKQLTDAEKEKMADIILINDESAFLIPQILALHQRFLIESNSK